ncbi:MAG: hypothetical protein LBS97_02050 [Treponema sp.]|jgi:hypothetical protein|nr:hypothetical protein [Treponema sp.]
MTTAVESWLRKRSAKVLPWFPEPGSGAGTEYAWRGVAVVVPLLDEEFTPTLESLTTAWNYAAPYTDDRTPEEEVRVYCVVNNRRNERAEIKERNRALLAYLNDAAGREGASIASRHGIRLVPIDAASEGRELPEGEGAGFARKIGMDYALSQGASVIACMDGDTLISKNYFQVLYDFRQTALEADAGCLSFLHQSGETPEAERAIRSYELFLSGHSRKLKECGSIYYQTALTPRIVCTREAYMQSGGMNTRTAGEDFYFLQGLVKICYGKGRLPVELPAAVYPSARISNRTPFGTGQKISELMAGNPLPAYSDFVYEQIKAFISLMNEHIQENRSDLPGKIRERLPEVCVFLEANSFFQDWEKIQAAAPDAERLRRAFHFWFDGLRIIRLIHYLQTHP